MVAHQVADGKSLQRNRENMSKDDYHVIVYQILSYLYVQLKAGEPVDGDFIKNDSTYLQINERYWVYVIENLILQGYIRGPVITKAWGGEKFITDLADTQITPAGIEYLCDNSFLSKAKEFLKDIKAIVPFV